MILPITLKLVLRSWRRNKTFAIISILSLAIGIACTNLLITFVIHEFNIEAGNTKKERILQISQDSPMKKGEEVSFVSENIPALLKERYGEVEAVVRFGKNMHNFYSVDNVTYPPLNLVTTDTSFTDFFPYEVKYGNLKEALSTLDKLALSEKTATRLFGKESALGKIIIFSTVESGNVPYQVVAVVKEREQSFIKFDALTQNSSGFFGGTSFLLMKDKPNIPSFAAKVKKDKIPTLQGETGSYHFHTLKESYFINHRQPTLLYVGLVSALLILLIACFNYVNLNFSRILQQIKMLHTEKLMGASHGYIRKQLFTDTFLTVFIAFLLSLLLMHDFLPAFNEIVSAQLAAAFFYNKQVFPVILSFVLLLSVIPATYISSKLSIISGNDYKRFYTGRKKQLIVSGLVIIQFAISIGLITSSVTVSKQLNLTRQNGIRYHNCIEIGNEMANNSYIQPLAAELRKNSNITDICISNSSLLNSWTKQIITKNPDGTENYYSELQYQADPSFLKTMNIRLITGTEPDEAISKYPRPVYINQKFTDLLVPKGVNPIGSSLSTYDTSFREDTTNVSTIAGIVENVHTGSMEEEVNPATIALYSNSNSFPYLYIRIGDKNYQETFNQVKTLWEKYNPGQYFSYQHMEEIYLERNRKTTQLTNLLFMYSLISILLTCFGLFGMALYATEQRIKEIGIRKVNGASVGQILLLLNKQFIGWILIAFVLITPLCTYLLNKWLENFVYRTELSITTSLISTGFILCITLFTASWHSYKAARSNPVICLQNE